MPVPTRGFSVRSVGTAWRCMFDPSARLASSCSRNGINEGPPRRSSGDTSMKLIRSRGINVNSFWKRHRHQVVAQVASRRWWRWPAIAYWPRRSPTGSRCLGDPAVRSPAVRRLEEAVMVGARRPRQRVISRCSGLPGSRSGRRGRSASGARRAPRSRRARGSGRRAERRDATLVRHLRQRVVLVHELRQLRGAEELLDRGRDGLGVDHRPAASAVGLRDGQAFLDGALDAHQADAEGVLAISPTERTRGCQVVDVVDSAVAVADRRSAPSDVDDVLRSTARRSASMPPVAADGG